MLWVLDDGFGRVGQAGGRAASAERRLSDTGERAGERCLTMWSEPSNRDWPVQLCCKGVKVPRDTKRRKKKGSPGHFLSNQTKLLCGTGRRLLTPG